MMRPVARTFRHIALAVFLIVAGVCMLEVGLRAHHLKTVLDGQAESVDSQLIRPCPLAYQHLPFDFSGPYRCQETDADIEIEINSLGLRGREVIVPKPAGHYRIVCLGDDATLSPSIGEEHTFSHLLQDMLQPGFDASVDVINAGQPGHCPLLSLAWARGRLIGLQPDLVILCCDVSDVSDDRRCRPLAKFDNSGMLLSVGHPAAKVRPTDWFSAVEQDFLIARWLGEHLGDRITRQFAPVEDSDDSNEPQQQKGLSAAGHPAALVEQTWEPLAPLQALCRQISSDFVVAVVPSSDTVRAAASAEDADPPGRVSEMLALLVSRANRDQIPMLDASPEFLRQDERSRLFLESSGALSAEGHRLFAEILSRALLSRGSQQSVPETVPVGGEIPVSGDVPPTEVVPAESHVPIGRSNGDPGKAAGSSEAPVTTDRSSPLPTLERRPRAAE